MKIRNISFIVVIALLSSFSALAAEATLEETMSWVTKKLASDGCHEVEIPSNRLAHSEGAIISSRFELTQKLSTINPSHYQIKKTEQQTIKYENDRLSQYNRGNYEFSFFLHHIKSVNVITPTSIIEPNYNTDVPNAHFGCWGIKLDFKEGTLKQSSNIIGKASSLYLYLGEEIMAFRVKKAFKHAIVLAKQAESDEPF